METELRHLSASHVSRLGQILAVDSQWKELMAAIDTEEGTPLFTSDDMHVLEQAVDAQRSGFALLVSEWGSMGDRRTRPRLRHLLELCKRIEALRAAHYIEEKILTDEPSQKDNKEEIEQKLEHLYDDLNNDSLDLEPNSDLFTVPLANENSLGVPRLPYAYLTSITNDFDRLVGRGGFADVFLGITARKEIRLAVKRLRMEGEDQASQMYNMEVGETSSWRHHSILPILGYSNDIVPCLVYPYMANGNLEHCLATMQLSVQQRINVALGLAEALHFLHSRPKPLIHRDVKSPNVLLDDQLWPKLADFGLLRVASRGDTSTMHVRGTLRYMAPEAIRGDISVKVDVFSYGAVLLEILTGLPSYDEKRENKDLITHIEDILDEAESNDEIDTVRLSLLDDRAGPWPIDVSQKLWDITMNCLKEKKGRPHIKDVLMIIANIKNFSKAET